MGEQVMVLGRAQTARGTGSYMQTMNVGTRHQKLMTSCMVSNIIKTLFKKRKREINSKGILRGKENHTQKK